MVDAAEASAPKAAPPPRGLLSSIFRRGDTEHLAPWQLIAFGLPAIPLMVMQSPVNLFVGPYLTSGLGITLTTWAMIIGVTRIVDLSTDPFVGMICDRLPSRWGRRRHWIAISLPTLMFSCALLFTPKYFTSHVGFWYVLIALLLFNLSTTIKGLNLRAWAGELSSRYDERNRIMGWREALAHCAQITAFGIPAIMEWALPQATMGDKLEVLMWTAMTLAPIAALAAILAVGEKPMDAIDRKQQQGFSLADIWATLKNMVTNRYFRWLVMIELLHAGPTSIKIGLFVFFMGHVMQAGHMIGTILLGMYVMGLLFTPVWMWLAKGREKHHLMAIGIMGFGLCQLSMLFMPPGQYGLLLAVNLLSGALHLGPAFLMTSIMADVIDSDTAKNGKRQTGAFFAVTETLMKLAPTLAVVALFPILEAGGFDPASKTNSPEALNMVRVMFTLVPTIPVLLAAVLLWNFPLGSKRHSELRQQIEAMRAGQNAPPT